MPVKLIVFIIWMLASSVSHPQALSFAVPSDVWNRVRLLVSSGEHLSLERYQRDQFYRDEVEILLMYQALSLGGLGVQLRPVMEADYRETLNRVATGDITLSGSSVWYRDVNPDEYFITRALIRPGEFVAGLYTVSSNRQAMSTKTLADIQKLKAVSSRDWSVDWQTLRQLPFKQLSHSGSTMLMYSMVLSGRADVLLAPFSAAEDMSLVYYTDAFIPVPGIKVALAGSRHWVVSRAHPDSEAIYAALERGLKQLRAKGLVIQAYRDSGFFHPQVRDWTLINPSVP